jgi:hypothetical protein
MKDRSCETSTAFAAMVRVRSRLTSRGARHAWRVLAALALSTCASTVLALKVDMYAIGNWSGGNCAPGDTDSDRGSWPGMAAAWYDRMGAHGHSRTGKFVDGNMTLRRFCDPRFNAGCQDMSYVDWPDAAIVAAHGWDDGNRWGALMRNSWNGQCGATMGNGGNMAVGDANLKFLHASSCLSLNDTYFNGMREAMRKAGSFKGLHVMTGFHGLMWISSSFNDDYRDTASDGHVVSVATSWVTNHYKSNNRGCASYDPFNWFGTCQDQCPTAMTVAASGGFALNRLLNERYNNSGSFGSPGGNSHYAWMGYVGCDPVGENAFNP